MTNKTKQIQLKVPIPKSKNQQLFLDAIKKNDIVFSNGPSGAGKSFLSVGAATQLLFNGEIEKIIITRPMIGVDQEEIGFLPGDASEKFLPLISHLFDEFEHFLGKGGIDKLIKDKKLEIIPILFARGKSWIEAAVILDEAQNCSIGQLKMFLTRISKGSKLIINGDFTQTDLPPYKAGAFEKCMRA
jgi:phosphate starvation-inducible PhoH-like protein